MSKYICYDRLNKSSIVCILRKTKVMPQLVVRWTDRNGVDGDDEYTSNITLGNDKSFEEYDYQKTLLAVIPSNVVKIPEYLFAGYERLVTVELPNTLTKIGAGAFSHCESISGCTVPQHLVEIGDNAFHNCYQLSFDPDTCCITLPSSLSFIGAGAFYGCSRG